MSDYTADHAGALADVTADGAAVTFTLQVPGPHDPATGTFAAGTTTTVTGSAIQLDARPETYRALGLVETEARTLFFTPTTYGSLPALKSSVTWGGVAYTVRDVAPLAPDGFAIAAEVTVAR